MDLLEIRKKAREKKEAEEAAKAAAKAAGEAGSQDAGEPSGADEAAPAEPAPPPRKAGKKSGARKKASAKPPVPAPEEPAAPEPDYAAVDDGLEIILDEAQPAEAAHEEPPAVEPMREGPPKRDAAASGPPPAGDEEGPESPSFAADEEAHEAEDEVVEYLAFMLADEEYAVRVEDVKEIIRLQRTTTVPRAESFVEGIISLRGVIIPVYDIKKRLGLETAERQRSARILIVSDDGTPQGMIVDKVTGVARLRGSAIEPPPAVIGGVEGEYLEGVGRIGDRLLILFNTNKVLSMDSGVSG